MGLSVAILALLSGAGKVIVIDKFESRLAVAKSFDVDETLAIKADAPQQHIERALELTNGYDADITIEATDVPNAVKEGGSSVLEVIIKCNECFGKPVIQALYLS
ncbi:zinc-binding dehydrogenase [Microcoleus sp. N3A4]